MRAQIDKPDGATADAGSRTSPTAARRIAIVMHGFTGGGMERSMLRLGEGFLARGYAVDFLVGKIHGELVDDVPREARVVELDKASVHGARWHALAADLASWSMVFRPRTRLAGLKPLMRRVPPLVKHLRRSRPDAILAAEPRYNLMAVWARQRSGLTSRVVISERIQVSSHAAFDGPWRDRRMHPLLRRGYLAADAIVSVSDGVADDLAAHAAIPRERITTVYNPVVGPDLLLKAKAVLDHPWFAAGAPPVVLAAGRLDPQKDFSTLIRAFAQVRSKRAARLLILGGTDWSQRAYAEELKQLPGQLGVAEDVSMPGFADNPFAYMARASVFVLSSLYEGLPGVLIQALACGCPVVSTDCPSGPTEILEQGRYGPLIDVGNADAMAQAIEDQLDHPPTAEVLQGRAALFSVDRSVERHLELLFGTEQEVRTAEGSI